MSHHQALYFVRTAFSVFKFVYSLLVRYEPKHVAGVYKYSSCVQLLLLWFKGVCAQDVFEKCWD
jgi:hypothetical protein